LRYLKLRQQITHSRRINNISTHTDLVAIRLALYPSSDIDSLAEIIETLIQRYGY